MAINPKAWHLYGTGLLELATIDPNDEPQYRKQEFGWRPLYDQTAVGEQRGDPKAKDAYMFTNVTVSYRFPYRRRTRSKF